MRKFTRRTTVLAGAVAFASVAGVAFAAWTSTGSGSGTATSDTVHDLSFTGSTPADSLYPTGSSHVALTIANPNRYKAALSHWLVTGVYAAADTSFGTNIKSTCDLTFTLPADGDVVVAGSALTAPLTIPVAMGNASSNDPCSSQTFVVKLTANAASTTAAATTSDPTP